MNWIQRLATRLFKLGPGMDTSQMIWGVSPESYSPAEYGDYIATSNAVYACVTLRAMMLSSLPLRLYKGEGNNRREVKEGRLYNLLRLVNPYWTFNRLIQMTEMSLGLWGQSFWILERGRDGKQPPREIWWVRPDRMWVVPHETEYIAHYVYHAPNGQTIPLTSGEVLWMRHPNPIDEFAGLSPLAAARLAADVGNSAMKSNYNLFKQGMQLGGGVFPRNGMTLSQEQAEYIEKRIAQRYSGVDKAHKWVVFRFDADMRQFGVTPKDAEFLGALNFSLEEIARAYHVPLDMLGGQRTYENVSMAHKAMWTHCLLPQAEFIASEITEFLLPMFGEADTAEFDSSGIEVLHEDEMAAWTRSYQKIQIGAMTINEWRMSQGLPPVPWGDAWWANSTLMQVGGTDAPTTETKPRTPSAEKETAGDESEKDRGRHRRSILPDYGSPAHRALLRQWYNRISPYETAIARVVVGLFKRLEESILSRLGHTPPEQVQERPFDRPRWERAYADGIEGALRDIVAQEGAHALRELGLMIDFDSNDPRVSQFIRESAQRFAVEVLDTMWRMLRESLGEGLDKGESIEELAERVKSVMGDRIRSTPETIARTESGRAANAGLLEGWRQSGIVKGKQWLAALDDRTRDTHIEAHGQKRALDEDFEVGDAKGPAPGQMGVPEEDINCRCTMLSLLE